MEVDMLMVRRLRHRLNTLGMLEVEVWLSVFAKELERQGVEHAPWLGALDALLAQETPDIQAVMEGRAPMPEALEAYLVKQA